MLSGGSLRTYHQTDIYEMEETPCPASEFPESLVSDSKHRVSRFRTRLSLGIEIEIRSMALSSLGLGLGIEAYNMLESVSDSESKLTYCKVSELNIFQWGLGQNLLEHNMMRNIVLFSSNHC